jgi:hypothetical protein
MKSSNLVDCSKQVGDARAVRHQTAELHELACLVHRGQPVLRRELHGVQHADACESSRRLRVSGERPDEERDDRENDPDEP